MRVVFDSNIFISAFVFPGGEAEKAYLLAIRGMVELYSSPAIITEVAAKLRTKFNWDEPHTSDAVRSMGRVASLVKPPRRLTVLADEPDNRILECALDANAALIVTGDRHLLKLSSYENVVIVRLRDFLGSFPGEGSVCYET